MTFDGPVIRTLRFDLSYQNFYFLNLMAVGVVRLLEASIWGVIKRDSKCVLGSVIKPLLQLFPVLSRLNGRTLS